MSDAPPADLTARVQALVALIERNWGARPTLDHPTIVEWELAWRRANRPRFQAWLDGDDAQSIGKVAQLLGLFQSEYRDLRVCFEHPKNADTLAALRRTLAAARTAPDRTKVFSDVIALVQRMEDVARARPEEGRRVVNGVARKWTVMTALVSFADERFPFIRPTNTDPDGGPYAAAVFGGLSWQSTPSPERYSAYCARVDALCQTLVSCGLVEGAVSPLEASAWGIAAHVLAREPDALTALARLVARKPVILQGPPGTGKTRRAEGLAALVARERGGRVVPLDQFDAPDGVAVVTAFVQFHASFDYEDFVRGFQPRVVDGTVAFELRDGPFVQMASLALKHPDITFLLVVDEINRADIARVLGECIYLLDRRVPHVAPSGPTVQGVLAGQHPGAVALRYTPERPAPTPADYGAGQLLGRLCVPTNFLLVGTMNTADRSIAVVDVALRRRFAFLDVDPDVDVVRAHQPAAHRERLAGWMRQLNGEEGDPGLIRDARYHVGHSYFLGDADTVRASLRYQLLPLLDEYRREQRLVGDEEEIDALLDAIHRFPEA